MTEELYFFMNADKIINLVLFSLIYTNSFFSFFQTTEINYNNKVPLKINAIKSLI